MTADQSPQSARTPEQVLALPYDPIAAIEQLHLAEGAGWRDQEKFRTAIAAILVDIRVVIHEPHLDLEAYATAHNAGWDAAVAQMEAEPVGGITLTRDERAAIHTAAISHPFNKHRPNAAANLRALDERLGAVL